MSFHPSRDEIVVMDKDSFHLLKANIEIPFSLNDNTEIYTSKLYLNEEGGNVGWYGFFWKRRDSYYENF